MKIISIKQPWASLIVEGYKRYEFRTWKTKYRGKILIHASKGFVKSDINEFKHLNLSFPTGVIIGEVELIDCIEVNEILSKKIFEEDNIVYRNVLGFQGYAWKIDKIKKYDEHIQINGKLGLWEYEKE